MRAAWWARGLTAACPVPQTHSSKPWAPCAQPEPSASCRCPLSWLTNPGNPCLGRQRPLPPCGPALYCSGHSPCRPPCRSCSCAHLHLAEPAAGCCPGPSSSGGRHAVPLTLHSPAAGTAHVPAAWQASLLLAGMQLLWRACSEGPHHVWQRPSMQQKTALQDSPLACSRRLQVDQSRQAGHCSAASCACHSTRWAALHPQMCLPAAVKPSTPVRLGARLPQPRPAACRYPCTQQMRR